MTHTAGLELRRGTDAIKGHNMIEIKVDGRWYPLTQMGIASISGPTLDAVAIQYRELGDIAARLLLAAPDLLAALTEIARVCRDNLDLGPNHCKGGMFDYFLDMARAAIAKVEAR